MFVYQHQMHLCPFFGNLIEYEINDPNSDHDANSTSSINFEADLLARVVLSFKCMPI
jgi:hypothetical protein